MKKYLYILGLAAIGFSSCKKEYLERPPLDQLSDENYWSSENNVRIFSWGFYPAYFPAYGSGFTWGRYFSGQSLNDDFAGTAPAPWVQNVPSTSGNWTFTWVRKANLFLNRIQKVPMPEEAINHWSGVARFFRALEYHDLVKRYGDVPWYDQVIENESDVEKLFKPRDSRTFVMDKVLEDLQYAAEHVRESDGQKGLVVNKSVVLAFMSRIMLFEGTWLKYHGIDEAKATTYLQAAKWAAEQVINSGNFQIADNYRAVFSSNDLSSFKEIILYRKYETGMLTHALMSYNNNEPQTGISRNAVESYLASDGLPISISPVYQGDQGIENVMANRDPRLAQTVVGALRINQYAANYSTSGYSVHKFLNEALKNAPEASGSLNQTDGPVIRYGEVLMNYAEAAAELGNITQADLDKSINVLRKRPGIGLPDLQVIGGEPAVNGVVYDDPERDPTVPSLIWEIRRERRTELMMEGFRLDDLRRWKKLEYADTQDNPTINRGAWISKTDYPDTDAHIEGDANEGYIVPAIKQESQRLFTDPKVYLDPLPLDQIKLYQDNGYTLTQNPGW